MSERFIKLQYAAPGSLSAMADEDGTQAGQMDAPGRVTLRSSAESDERELLELAHASVHLHHPWISVPSTPAEFQAYIRRYEQSSDESLLICLRGTGAIAGLVNINSIVRGRFQSGSLGYAAFAPTAGQGYMSEGLGLVIRYAFEQLRLHRLEAAIQPGNHASINLVRRLGFRNEGYSPEMLFIDGAWRDHERWAITTTMTGATINPHPTLPER
jgi:[ribosomal protein S5]-alanine N-acetyltransferase